jgi:hypothetical protein
VRAQLDHRSRNAKSQGLITPADCFAVVEQVFASMARNRPTTFRSSTRQRSKPDLKPPYWVHAALWLPLIMVVTLGPLRPMKGLMIALQYHHKAAESRFGGEGS